MEFSEPKVTIDLSEYNILKQQKEDRENGTFNGVKYDKMEEIMYRFIKSAYVPEKERQLFLSSIMKDFGVDLVIDHTGLGIVKLKKIK